MRSFSQNKDMYNTQKMYRLYKQMSERHCYKHCKLLVYERIDSLILFSQEWISIKITYSRLLFLLCKESQSGFHANY